MTIALAAASADFPDLEAATAGAEPDWAFSLMCASALTGANHELAQDTILRVALGCLRSDITTPAHKSAALLLLERVGNRPAMTLAVSRKLSTALDYADVPLGLAADSVRRRAELTISDITGDPFEVNPFQKLFWEKANTNGWISVSAPTSAGKSHIVRQWFREQVLANDSACLAYIAPTRALVEEVSSEFRKVFPRSVGIHTLPWDPEIETRSRQIFVMTQERLHLLLQRRPELMPQVVFVDEAQKIAEGTRGILLSQVLDEVVNRNAETRLIFASPLTDNPEVLIADSHRQRTRSAIVGESVTVNQNLIFAKQVPRKPKAYTCSLSFQGEERDLGVLMLPAAPDGVGQKVPLIAAAMGRHLGGNLVYANGPAEAEKYAEILYLALGADADDSDPDLDDLIDLATGVVHERFSLARVARRGIAFHYGDMPLVIKAKVEELFKSGVLRYLVCTSTLLEGVNLPCRNIFIRGPRKGWSTKMSLPDFWNLAGRAGRWGKEFQGNIVCIDVDNKDAWPEKPGRRQRSSIVPAAHVVFENLDQIIGYIDEGAEISGAKGVAERESAFSWMAGRYLQDRLAKPLLGVDVSESDRARLAITLETSLADVSLDSQIVKKHAGISPLSMERLLAAVKVHPNPDKLPLVPPTSDDAFEEYKLVLDLVAEHLGGSFQPETRRLSLARLIVHWMRGVPLSVIIENRAKRLRRRGEPVNYPKLIRKVMEDVEDIARYEAPKYLSCYSDVVAYAAGKYGVDGRDDVGSDIAMMLELGVPRRTDMSFIAVGLSRATTRAIAPYVAHSDWAPAQCTAWIEDTNVEELDIASFANTEISRLKQLLKSRGK